MKPQTPNNEVEFSSKQTMLTAQSDSVELYHALCDRLKDLIEKTNEVERLREEKEYWANQWNVLRQSSVSDVVKAQEEVGRLRELLNRAIDAIPDSLMDEDGGLYENTEHTKLKAELARLTPSPEEPVIQDSRITEPEWREFTGTNEMVLKGDQEMHKTGDTEWHEVSFDVGSTARRNPKYRFRTRRPLPKPTLSRDSYDEDWNLKQKQEEMPLDEIEQSLKWIEGDGKYPLDHDEMFGEVVNCIRYILNEIKRIDRALNVGEEDSGHNFVEINKLRDEIQKLKEK